MLMLIARSVFPTRLRRPFVESGRAKTVRAFLGFVVLLEVRMLPHLEPPKAVRFCV